MDSDGHVPTGWWLKGDLEPISLAAIAVPTNTARGRRAGLTVSGRHTYSLTSPAPLCRSNLPPDHETESSPLRVAVVGSGISGLGAAWLLQRRHEVHVFERDARIGGHTDTREVPTSAGTLNVDTGFIVYNEVTYPLLVRLFDELGIATQPSSMSWSLRCERCNLEYAGSARGLVAQPRRIMDTQHLRMVRDLLAFHRVARQLRADPRIADMTLGAFLATSGTLVGHRFGRGFSQHYLLPMTAAIWSSGTGSVEEFPLKGLLEFLDNHGLLGVSTHHPWRTVTGGAARYVDAITRDFTGGLHAGIGVDRIVRDAGGVDLTLTDGRRERFDAVVLATHADQALKMLAEPTDDERALLGAWSYTANERWLHTDASLMPQRRQTWSSWNYLLQDCHNPTTVPSLSYWANRLQNLDGPNNVFVTLNPHRPPVAPIRHDHVSHPAYTLRSMATHPALPALNGARRTWFAGAYQRWGFHEDGLWSAVRVAEDLGVPWPN